jgi:hypothetical protein
MLYMLYMCSRQRTRPTTDANMLPLKVLEQLTIQKKVGEHMDIAHNKFIILKSKDQ